MSLKIPFRTPRLLWKEKSPIDLEEFGDAANILATNDAAIVDFDGPQDSSIAVNWEPRKKWILIMVLSSMTFITYMFSSSFGIHIQLTSKKARSPQQCLLREYLNLWVNFVRRIACWPPSWSQSTSWETLLVPFCSLLYQVRIEKQKSSILAQSGHN